MIATSSGRGVDAKQNNPVHKRTVYHTEEAEFHTLELSFFFCFRKAAPPTHYVDIPNGHLRARKSSRLALLKKFTGHKYLFSSNNFCCKANKNAVHQSL